MKQKVTWKNVCILQAVIILYTLSSIMAKFASGNAFFSFRFFLFYGLEIALIGVYAIAWQQMIKRFDLSVAYANRAIALFWSMIWSVLIFKEQITAKNICGVVLVMLGIVIINTEQPARKEQTEKQIEKQKEKQTEIQDEMGGEDHE